jgi:G3E family GTPase
MQNSAGLKIGCLVNDLAAVNIDADFIKGKTSQQDGANRFSVQALSNGCLCCDGSAELIKGIKVLLKEADPSSYPQNCNDSASVGSKTSFRGGGIDQIVVECSGVAEPAQVVTKLLNAGNG